MSRARNTTVQPARPVGFPRIRVDLSNHDLHRSSVFRGGVTSGWKSKLLASISLFLVSKSDFLVSISLLLVSKSDFLVSISLFLVSKSDFLAADQLSLRSPAAPVAGSFLYMPPRATAFTVLLLPPGDSMQGWSHRPRRPSLFLLRELDCLRRLFQELA